MLAKILTAKNWTQPDPAHDVLQVLDLQTGLVRPHSGDEWAERFLAVELSEKVPQDLGDLFTVARATMIYGYFYYPLYALAEEQLHRVADVAVEMRYKALGGALTKKGYVPWFTDQLDFLIKRGVIPEAERARWKAYHELRNIGSHPDFQSLHTPRDVLVSLRLVARSVSELFENEPSREEASP